MSTTKPQPTPSSNDNSKQRIIAIAAVVIVALLAVNAWLLYKYTQADNAKETLTTELSESQKLQEELNDQYYAARAELESMRTESAEMNAMIERQQEELAAAKDRIAALIRQGGNADAARAELNDLKQQVNGYVAELNQLREENAMLANANQELTQERDVLQTDLSSQRQANEDLSQERNQLQAQRDQLDNQNQNLSRKVNQAATIKVAGLEAVGQKIRNSGKPVTRRDASNVERIAVTFNTVPNEIAEGGTEIFYVRIMDAQGVTLALDQLGSGVFKNQATGQDMRYTMKYEVDYDGTPESLQLIWNPGQQFAAGTYQVEVYNKGYLAGTTTMRLR